MKTEQELLKEICDKIWYNSIDVLDNNNRYIDPFLNVREIIFTPEFIDRVIFKVTLDKNLTESEWRKRVEKIIYHLNNPVSYLANLLDIKN